MRIGIDIDDTITDSIEQVRKYMHKYGHLYCKNNELKEKEAELMRGTLKDKTLSLFFQNHSIEISNHVKVKKDAKKVINKLHDEGHEIIIITARSDNYYKDAQEYCSNYLKKNGIHYDKLITAKVYKDKLCKNEHIDLMIDDAIDTCESVEKMGIKGLVFNSEINRNKQTICNRVNNWAEVYDYINNLEN